MYYKPTKRIKGKLGESIENGGRRVRGDDPHNTYNNILVRNSVIIMHLNGQTDTSVMTCVYGE